jgi:hypothetical protein
MSWALAWLRLRGMRPAVARSAGVGIIVVVLERVLEVDW